MTESGRDVVSWTAFSQGAPASDRPIELAKFPMEAGDRPPWFGIGHFGEMPEIRNGATHWRYLPTVPDELTTVKAELVEAQAEITRLRSQGGGLPPPVEEAGGTPPLLAASRIDGELWVRASDCMSALSAAVAAETERCAKWHDEQAVKQQAIAADNKGYLNVAEHAATIAAVHRRSAAAIRARSGGAEDGK